MPVTGARYGTTRRAMKGTHAAAEWQVMTSARLDYANCTADLVIPPRSTAWILINATCEDSEKLLARNPAVRPTIQSLSATQGGRRMSLEGWDVARAFKRRSGFCTLKIDADDLK
jgi:hypothetical protein